MLSGFIKLFCCILMFVLLASCSGVKKVKDTGVKSIEPSLLEYEEFSNYVLFCSGGMAITEDVIVDMYGIYEEAISSIFHESDIDALIGPIWGSVGTIDESNLTPEQYSTLLDCFSRFIQEVTVGLPPMMATFKAYSASEVRIFTVPLLDWQRMYDVYAAKELEESDYYSLVEDWRTIHDWRIIALLEDGLLDEYFRGRINNNLLESMIPQGATRLVWTCGRGDRFLESRMIYPREGRRHVFEVFCL